DLIWRPSRDSGTVPETQSSATRMASTKGWLEDQWLARARLMPTAPASGAGAASGLRATVRAGAKVKSARRRRVIFARDIAQYAFFLVARPEIGLKMSWR